MNEFRSKYSCQLALHNTFVVSAIKLTPYLITLSQVNAIPYILISKMGSEFYLLITSSSILDMH